MIFKNPLVVGYKGEIGSFILQGLLRTMPKASNIWCFDINETEDERIDRIKKADFIFLCVPLQNTMAWLAKYKKYLTGKIIVEQCSLKSFLNHAPDNLTFVSMHILFRPSSTPDRDDRNCLLFSTYIDGFALALFANDVKNIIQSEVTVVDCNRDNHDKIMAENQAVFHRVLMVLSQMIRNKNTRTFVNKKVINLVDRIRSGDKNLYELIQKNPHTESAIKEFKKKLDDFDFEKSFCYKEET